jgi:hypothetical protein
MTKVVRLTEKDLTKLVNKVISEQQKHVPFSTHSKEEFAKHPVNNPLWKEMRSDVEGDGVETIKYVPNKMLVIDAFGNKYTITKG